VVAAELESSRVPELPDETPTDVLDSLDFREGGNVFEGVRKLLLEVLEAGRVPEVATALPALEPDS